MSRERYWMGVVDLAEGEAGLNVQFLKLAAIYQLSRSEAHFGRSAALLRAARDEGSEVWVEIRGTQIVSVEPVRPE